MADEQTRAVVVPEHGGSEVLAIDSRDVAPPGPGQIQVRLAAGGVNFVDVYEREGVYPTEPPFVLGKEGAGEVVAVGEGVEGLEPGETVAWADVRASFSGFVNAPAAAVVPVPTGVGSDTAAAAMLQGMTAHYLVTSTCPIQAGDSVLIHAAAGGVGQLLVQMAKSRGATVIATTSTPRKVEIAQAAGADQVIRYDEADDLAAEVRRRNGGRGVNVVYDGVGKATFDASLAALTTRGMLVLFGAASGQVPPFDLQRLNRGGSLFVTRPTLAHYTATREELLWRGGAVLDAVRDGALRIQIGGRYPFDRVRDAYDDLEGRRTTGKLLLIP